MSTLARDPGSHDEGAVLPEEALRRLREGNQRFVQNLRSVDVRLGQVARANLAFGQRPFAIVLSCSDSRAITATLELIEKGTHAPSEDIDQIIQRIRPSIEGLVRAPTGRDAFVAAAVRANLRASAEHLRHASRLLEDRIAHGAFLVVGAEYALDTGTVDFFDGLPS